MIQPELHLFFTELKALNAARHAAIKAWKKTLKSHKFIVAKYPALEELEKTKACSVADGQDQDATMFPNKSSTTVVIPLIFAMLVHPVQCSGRLLSRSK